LIHKAPLADVSRVHAKADAITSFSHSLLMLKITLSKI
jgi:hypothetical protein